MTKKKRYGPAIGSAAACIAVLYVAGACSKTANEEKAVHRVIVTTTSPAVTAQPVTNTTTALLTITSPIATTTESITETQITVTSTCATTATTTTVEHTSAADTTVQPITTTASAITTAPAPAEPYHGQTSGDYIYVNGFGWVFNEGGGGYGETNDEMYCNGNKIGYFG